ncbi:MAG: sulfatase-like hydrolase/transferase, partial [Muribaculaceae bacterium]|nr:sulfatase-like hydrolase/transferase [Muribaculaceae bacterium]
ICPGSLTMIHLNGQHIPAENRYPDSFRHFTASDYTDRSNLDNSQRLDIASYDNATLYNDSVLGRIFSLVQGKDAIVLYHTDHGEEIHDYRNHYGRTLEPVTPHIYNCIYHIPMVVYTTPEFRSNHADLYRRLEQAAQRPFNITHIPHLIITIGGVTTPWYRPQADPLSPLYDQDSARFGASG